MRLTGRRVGLWLTEAGITEKVAESAGLQTEPWVDVLDEDQKGLWIKARRADGNHLVLIRWEYVALLDLHLGDTKQQGLR